MLAAAAAIAILSTSAIGGATGTSDSQSRSAPDATTGLLPGVTASDYSPVSTRFPLAIYGGGNSASGRINAIAASADGNRVYAAAPTTGLWRSSDGGATWCQLSSIIPCSDGAASPVPVPVITEIAVAPSPADGSVVLVAAAFDNRTASKAGIYRSTDGGGTWHFVHDFVCGRQRRPALQVRFAPDEPSLVYAAGGCTVARSADAGVTWTETFPGAYASGVNHGDQPITAIAVSEAPYNDRTGHRQHRWIYACAPVGMFVSSNEGHTWTLDTTFVTLTGGACPYAQTPHLIAAEPGRTSRLYVAVDGRANRPGSNGPRFFDPGPDGVFGVNPQTGANDDVPPGTICRQPFTDAGGTSRPPIGCGEAGLWYGNFDNRSQPRWTQLASPPNYYGQGTPSGAPFVLTKTNPSGGYLVFFGDETTLHVHQGLPPTGATVAGGWHRLDGYDPWSATSYPTGTVGTYVHVDPHDLALTPSFAVSLLPPPGTCGSTPYGTVLCGDTIAGPSTGRIWQANDGGVYRSSNISSFLGSSAWRAATRDLTTLAITGPAVLTRAGAFAPALYGGTQDNSSWMLNPDGTGLWTVPDSCGDCAPFYEDEALPNEVVRVDNCRSNDYGLYVGSGQYPDTILVAGECGQTLPKVPYPVRGGIYPADETPLWTTRPLIQAIGGNTGWYGIPLFADLLYLDAVGLQLYRRLYTNLPGLPDPLPGWFAIGPAVPTGSVAVQAGGGHNLPTYYVQTSSGGLYQGAESAPLTVSAWTQRAPAAASGSNVGACNVRRFFVNPYSASNVWIDDAGGSGCPAGVTAGLKVTQDGGATWAAASSLQSVVTNGGEFLFACNSFFSSWPGAFGDPVSPYNCPLNYMSWIPSEPNTVVAVGTTGGFISVDAGVTWQRVFADAELPCSAASANLDTVTNGSNRSLYVFCYGRSVLRFDNVPGPPPPPPPQ